MKRISTTIPATISTQGTIKKVIVWKVGSLGILTTDANGNHESYLWSNLQGPNNPETEKTFQLLYS